MYRDGRIPRNSHVETTKKECHLARIYLRSWNLNYEWATQWIWSIVLLCRVFVWIRMISDALWNLRWCTLNGEAGSNWNPMWGGVEEYWNQGFSALEACCVTWLRFNVDGCWNMFIIWLQFVSRYNMFTILYNMYDIVHIVISYQCVYITCIRSMNRTDYFYIVLQSKDGVNIP